MNHVLPRPASRRSIILASLGAALLLGMVVLFAGVVRASALAALPAAEGPITSDTTWSTSLTVTSPITVTAAATLTIVPGVEVRFLPGTWLRIEGGLIAQGTQAQQIRMIPASDAGAPWLGVVLAQPAGNVRLQSVTISQAVVGLAINSTGAFQQQAGPTRVDVLDSLFESNTTAILADYAGATANMTVTLRNNLITNNTTGLQILNLANNSKIKLNHNSFVGNGVGLRASGQGQLRARQQWWGSADGPRVGDPLTCAAAPGAGDIVCGPVTFSPWSKRPTGRMILAAGAGGTLESALGQAAASDDDTLPSSTGTLTVPVGTFTQSVDLLISSRTPAELPAGLPGQPTQLGLEVIAAAGGQELHTFAPGHTLQLTIDYTDADLAGADPTKLKLLFWDAARQAWSTAGFTSMPDPANHRLNVQLEHLSRMRTAAVDLANVVYLPGVRR
jgi:hypothetical protein